MRSRLAEVKSALAEKYERLAKVARSQTKKRKLLHKVKVFRRQVEELSAP